MIDPADEFAILRRRMDALEEAAERRQYDGLGRMSRTLVGRMVDGGAMPTEVPGFFKVEFGTLDGTESAGEAVTFAASGGEGVFLVLGPVVPEVGDLLRARLIDGYWVTGGGGGCGSIRVHARLCADGDPFTLKTFSDAPGATVTVRDADDVEIGSGTSDSLGLVDIPITSAGTYTVAVAKAGYLTATKTVEATCTTNEVEVTLNYGIKVAVTGCGCGIEGATVAINRTSGGAYSATGTTDADGFVIFPVDPVAGHQYQYTAAATNYTTSATQTLNILSSFLCLPTSSVNLAIESGRWCFGGAPPVCIDVIPAAIDVTFPTDPSRLGSLSGATISVPKLATPIAATIYFRGVYAVSGMPPGGALDSTHVRVDLHWPSSSSPCTSPSAAVFAYATDSAGNIVTGVGGNISASKTSGTSNCPVVYATGPTYTYTATPGGGGTTTQAGTFTVTQ